jgi:hypothetical protein
MPMSTRGFPKQRPAARAAVRSADVTRPVVAAAAAGAFADGVGTGGAVAGGAVAGGRVVLCLAMGRGGSLAVGFASGAVAGFDGAGRLSAGLV